MPLELELMASWSRIRQWPRHAGLPGSIDEARKLDAPAYFPDLPCRLCKKRTLRLAADRSCIACNRAQVVKRETRAVLQAGDAVLLAINMAGAAARNGRAPRRIPWQCPEPHRSQLQALIDRIRQDPKAGKAVVALLQTMRELRKTELAQQRAAESTTAAESNT